MTYQAEAAGYGRRPGQGTHALAQGLGWFSIGLGLAEVLAPGALARALGMRGSEKLIFGYGVREIATGLAILSSKDPTGWIWGRVAGDALDIATLATGMGEDNPQRGNVRLALAAVAGVTALDVICAQRLSAVRAHSRQAGRVLRDYGGRSGFPRDAQSMRGAASDFEIPRDMRGPEALRPYVTRAIGTEADSAASTRVGAEAGLA